MITQMFLKDGINVNLEKVHNTQMRGFTVGKEGVLELQLKNNSLIRIIYASGTVSVPLTNVLYLTEVEKSDATK